MSQELLYYIKFHIKCHTNKAFLFLELTLAESFQFFDFVLKIFCMIVLSWELKLNVFSTEISKTVSARGVCWSTWESVWASLQTAYLSATGLLSCRVHQLSSHTLQVWLYKVLSESMCGIWTYWRAHKLSQILCILVDNTSCKWEWHQRLLIG